MNKAQFLELLSQKLSEDLSRADVIGHVNYYETYINEEIGKGRSEEEVMMELGDPYMIARTILDTSSGSAYEDVVYEDAVSVDTEQGQNEKPKAKSFVMGNWGCLLTILILILLGISLISVIGSVVISLWPVFLPTVCVALILVVIRKLRR